MSQRDSCRCDSKALRSWCCSLLAAVHILLAFPGDGTAATDWVRLPPNLLFRDAAVGRGPAAAVGSKVELRVSFRAFNPNDVEFRGDSLQGLTFTLQTTDTCTARVPAISCLSQGVRDMRVGGKRVLILPPGFRERTVEIELVSVENGVENTSSPGSIQSGVSAVVEPMWKRWRRVPGYNEADAARVGPGVSIVLPRFEDVSQGSGAELTGDKSGVAIYQGFRYDASRPDFKGSLLDRMTLVLTPGNTFWAAARGMKGGGRRIVINAVHNDSPPADGYELFMVRVAATSEELGAFAARLRLNGNRTDAEVEAELAERRRAAEKASQPYQTVLQEARARESVDHTVFGIVLGAKWQGVQDVNTCNTKGWAEVSAVPICTESRKLAPGKRGTTCAGIDSNVFDTSWVRSPVRIPESTGSFLIDGIRALSTSAAIADQCKLSVDVLDSGEVGSITIFTARGTEETIRQQLTDKYKMRPKVAGPLTEYSWDLPNLSVLFAPNAQDTEQGGGVLVISTAAWNKIVEQEQLKNRKKPL